MSEQISEQISALLDGELPEAELSLLLRQVERQPSVLEQAYKIQQAHVCSQGDAPICLSKTLNLSTRIHAAIRNQDFNSSEESISSELGQVGRRVANAAYNQNLGQTVTNQAISSKSKLITGQTASNDSRWRPLFGAGIAAAVALVAVNAWQYQDQNNQSLEPSNLQVDSKEISNFETPTQTQAVANTLSASSVQQESRSYTVPNFESLNIDAPILSNNDFRQASYADYLLQNNVAPQSTSKQLSQFAQEQRATIYQEQYYIDPRSGQIVLSIKPIIE